MFADPQPTKAELAWLYTSRYDYQWFLKRRWPDHAICCHHNERRQQQEIERENAAAPADIKHSKIIWSPAVIEQDPGDQESREDKEKIDAAPELAERTVAVVKKGSVFGLDLAWHVVENQDEQNRHAANAIELGNAFLAGRPAEEHRGG
jgi:hypothetical protein